MPYNNKSLENLQQGNPPTQFTSGQSAVENGRKGGLSTAAKRRARKKEQEEWETLLSLAMERGEAEEIECLKDAKSKNMTVGKAMKVKLITEALKGNIRAYETIMHYYGADEKEEEQDQDGNESTTDNSFIKALNARAEDLWKDETDTEEDKTE